MSGRIRLSLRLAEIAKLTAPSRSVLDIGCDHALLVIYLLNHGLIDWAIGSDNKKEPLNRAKENIVKYDCKNLSLVLTDGASGIIQQAECVVMAGMGWHTVKMIMESSADYFAQAQRVIIQVNGEVEKLRQWLQQFGYRISDEKCLNDSGHYYEIVVAEKGEMKLTEQQTMFGPYLLKKPDEAFINHYRQLKQTTATILNHLPVGHPDCQMLNNQIDEIDKMLTAIKA